MPQSNGFGTTVYVGFNNMTNSVLSGSLTDFKMNKSADVKETIDGKGDVVYVAFQKRKKVANVEFLLYGSGSLITLPDIGDPFTMANPWTNEVSGTWRVTKPDLNFKVDSGATIALEITQWISNTGAILS